MIKERFDTELLAEEECARTALMLVYILFGHKGLNAIRNYLKHLEAP